MSNSIFHKGGNQPNIDLSATPDIASLMNSPALQTPHGQRLLEQINSVLSEIGMEGGGKRRKASKKGSKKASKRRSKKGSKKQSGGKREMNPSMKAVLDIKKSLKDKDSSLKDGPALTVIIWDLMKKYDRDAKR